MFLDKRKVKPDGSYPICFLICHNRKTTTRSAKSMSWKKTGMKKLKLQIECDYRQHYVFFVYSFYYN